MFSEYFEGQGTYLYLMHVPLKRHGTCCAVNMSTSRGVVSSHIRNMQRQWGRFPSGIYKETSNPVVDSLVIFNLHSYGHLPVISGQVVINGIIHSINGVLLVLITDKWP